MNEIHRRKFLKLLAAATTTLSVRNAWAEQKFEKNPFELGVASGSPTDSSVVLWTRLHDQGVFGSNIPKESIPVKWEVSRDRDFKDVIQSGVSKAIAELAHSVHVEVHGLPSNNWFFYRFTSGNMVSPVGRTRTMPSQSDPIKEFRIAYASCQHYELGYFSVYQDMIQSNPDLVMFLGDYIYEYPSGKTRVRSVSGSWCLSLEDYRQRYALYKADKDLQDIHAACPWILTWDDHEVQNDYAGTKMGSQGPNTDFAKRRAAAYQAYYEHMPIRAATLISGIEGLQRGEELRLYEHYQIGSLVGITMLDCRQYRDPQVCNPGNQTGSSSLDPKGCSELNEEGRTLLGKAQESWLDQQLKHKDKSVWNVIGQSTLFGPRIAVANDGSTRIWNDGWDGYPAARKRLISQVINNKTANLVVFGGDVHENWVGHIKEDYDSPSSRDIGVEFCGASIVSYDGHPKLVAHRIKHNRHLIYGDAEGKGYGLATISRDQIVVTLRISENVREKKSPATTLASFRVKSGTNRVKKI